MIKTLHHIWLGGKLPEEYVHLRDEALKINSDFSYKFWDEEALSREFGSEYDEVVAKADLLSKRSNVFRVMILERFGGVYMDTDFKHVRPLSSLSLSGCVVGNSEDFGIQGAFIYAEAGHKALTEWKKSPLLYSRTVPIEKGMTYMEDVDVLPASVFYSLPYSKRKVVNKPTPPKEAVAVHLWNGYWRGENNAHKTIPFHQIPAVVISLESNHERREALRLPFDYTVRIQKPIEGVIPSSDLTLGRIGCFEAHRDAVRYAQARNYPAILVLEDDAVWIGGNVSEIECSNPITFLGADSTTRTRVDEDSGLAYDVVRTTAVIYRKDAYDKLLNHYPTLERLKTCGRPVGGQNIDQVLSADGVSLSKHKLFTQSDAPSSIGHEDLTTTNLRIYSKYPNNNLHLKL